MRGRSVSLVLGVLLVCGCVSPYARMEQHDLRWIAEDRYAVADAMPARDKEEGYKKVHAYWESIEAIRHVEGADTMLSLDGRSMKRDEARELVRRKIKDAEKDAGITQVDYCGRAAVWTALIPYRFLKTGVDAVLMIAESPVTNVEW